MYCRNCGKIVDNNGVCSYCGMPMLQGNQYCPKCGQNTLATDEKCFYCGQNLIFPTQQKKQESNSGVGKPYAPTPPPLTNIENTIGNLQSGANRVAGNVKYCRNCGIEIDKNATICPYCQKSGGTNYCQICGGGTTSRDKTCPSCFSELDYSYTSNVQNTIEPSIPIPSYKKENHAGQTTQTDSTNKSFLLVLLLAIFFGYWGVHRFYTGHILIGVLQLLTGGGCGIWWLVDIIIIATGSYTDSKGNPLQRDV